MARVRRRERRPVACLADVVLCVCEHLQNMFHFLVTLAETVGSSDQMNNPPTWILNTTCNLLTRKGDIVANFAAAYQFNVGDAGVVTVDVIDGQLVLVSAEPKAGWTLSKAEDDSNDDSDELENEVEVEFASASVLVEFEAHLVDGQIVPKVEPKAIGGTATANLAVTAALALTTSLNLVKNWPASFFEVESIRREPSWAILPPTCAFTS